MSSMTSVTKWFNSFVGSRLVSVNALFHFLESEAEEEPQEVEFIFSDGSARVYGAGNGASLCFSSKSLSESDLGVYGRMEIRSISKRDLFSTIVGRNLVSVSFVKSLDVKIIVGVVLCFSEAVFLTVINLDDELNMFNIIPSEVMRSEHLYVDGFAEI